LNAPLPSAPFGLDCVVSGLPLPPFPPPAVPSAPASVWPVVSSVPTLRLLAPMRLMRPLMVALPDTRIVHGFGPWMSNVPESVTVKSWMSTRPPTTFC
jgi:hypothetical protein